MKELQRGGLVYVQDNRKGISRRKEGNDFSYYYRGRQLRNPSTLKRIYALAVPPAWNDVWICPDSRGHIQATGRDARGRKQYRYHTKWTARRNTAKFSRLLAFGQALPVLRERLSKDLSRRKLDEDRVLATVIRLMEETYIRIGGAEYERENGSFGLTTLKDRHVSVSRELLRFSFRGKSGVRHDIPLRNRQLARIVKQCRDIPGQELFQYYDDAGKRRAVDSGRVNAYLKSSMGDDFTAKDMRTWSGSLHALCIMKSRMKERLPVNQVVDEVSSKLGNTRAVCKKYYIHPFLLEQYEGGSLVIPSSARSKAGKFLSAEEKILLKILSAAEQKNNTGKKP